MKKSSKVTKVRDRWFEKTITPLKEGVKVDAIALYNHRDELEAVKLGNVEVDTRPIEDEQLVYDLRSTTKKVQTGEDAFPVFYLLDVPEKETKPFTKEIMDAFKKGTIPLETLKPLFKDAIAKLKGRANLKDTYVMHLGSSDPLAKELAEYLASEIPRAQVLHVPKVMYSLEGIEDVLEDAESGLSAQPEKDDQGIPIPQDRRKKPTKPTLAMLDSPYRTDAEIRSTLGKKYNAQLKNDYKLFPSIETLKNYFTDKQIRSLPKEKGRPFLQMGGKAFLKYQSEKTAEQRIKASAEFPDLMKKNSIYNDWTKDFENSEQYIEWKKLAGMITRRRTLRSLKKLKDKGYTDVQISKKLRGLTVSKLKSKYDLGLYPDIEDSYIGKFLQEDGLDDLVAAGKITEPQKAIIQGLRGEAFVLFVDDNIHSGTDFRKIGKGLEYLKEDMVDLDMIAGGTTRKLAPGERTGRLFNRRFDVGGTVAGNFGGFVLYRIDPSRGDILDTGLKRMQAQDKERRKNNMDRLY